jgi:ammonia channel protein AmtB
MLPEALLIPQVSKAVNEKLAELDQRVAAAQSSADNARMLVSAALVLMMTGPGLLKIVDLITGVRVPEEHEIEGLDVTQHGEEAYNLET